jgi:hypothetical protein
MKFLYLSLGAISLFSFSSLMQIPEAKSDIEGIPYNPAFPDAEYPYAQAPNGCGSMGLWGSTDVRDTWGNVDFTEACNNHDRCYYTLGSNSGNCNLDFYDNLRSSWERDLLVLDVTVVLAPVTLTSCYTIATTYYGAVEAGVWIDVFRDAQNLQRKYESWLRDLGSNITPWIRVPNGGTFGVWNSEVVCPTGTFASGFALKVEPDQGPGVRRGDDTALNAVRLYCSDSNGMIIDVIQSNEGDWGNWTEPEFCNTGNYLRGFRLRVEPPQGGGDNDDTAANDVEFVCDNGTSLRVSMPLGRWGIFGDFAYCLNGASIDGIRSNVEPHVVDGDDTALNDIRLRCSASSDRVKPPSNIDPIYIPPQTGAVPPQTDIPQY